MVGWAFFIGYSQKGRLRVILRNNNKKVLPFKTLNYGPNVYVLLKQFEKSITFMNLQGQEAFITAFNIRSLFDISPISE